MTNEPMNVFSRYVQSVGLKNTKQRELIAKTFFASKEHLKADEILEQVRITDKKISLATVYRTLKLLLSCGLARSHHFGDEQAKYEPTSSQNEHHDHLICTECKKIIEFYDKKIEAIQNDIAKHYSFDVTFHRVELYGVCEECQNGKGHDKAGFVKVAVRQDDKGTHASL